MNLMQTNFILLRITMSESEVKAWANLASSNKNTFAKLVPNGLAIHNTLYIGTSLVHTWEVLVAAVLVTTVEQVQVAAGPEVEQDDIIGGGGLQLTLSCNLGLVQHIHLTMVRKQ